MPQAFLDRGQERGLLAGLDIDDAIGMQPRLGQSGGEQVAPGQAPQHRALEPRRDPGSEQSCGRPMNRPVATAGHLVQRAERQAAARQTPVDRLDSERERAARTSAARFELGDALAKRGNRGF